MNLLILMNRDGVVFSAETDRGDGDFAGVATWGRDRIFVLTHVGSLDGLGDLGPDFTGAIYAEVEPWRINTHTVDLPRPKRQRKARIFDFAKFRAERTGGVA